jgi:hypothetical protein
LIRHSSLPSLWFPFPFAFSPLDPHFLLQWDQHKKREKKIFVNLFEDEAVAAPPTSTDYVEVRFVADR